MNAHYRRIKADRALVTDRQRDYADGIKAGRHDRHNCETEADIVWYVGVAYGNLWDTRPHYVAGYNDGINGK